MVVTIATIERFLERGTWHFDHPKVAAEKKLLATFDDRDGRAFDDDPESQKEWQRRHRLREQLNERYDSFDAAIKGAFRSRDGRHFRWQLFSSTFLSLETDTYSLCFLELSDRDAINLEQLLVEVSGDVRDEKIKRPELAQDTLRVSKDSLPGAGNFRHLSGELIAEFCRTGKEVEGPWSVTGAECRWVTTLWFPDWKEHLEKYPPLPPNDGQGNFVVGGLLGDGSFAAIFEDASGSLWRARLISDACLMLQDSQGRKLYLQHPGVESGGSGRVILTEEGR